MSVIQALREKYATVVVIVVCISLVAFLLMDALVGPKSFFNHEKDVVSVNGVGYEYNHYMQDVKIAENNYRSQHPDEKLDEQTRNQIKNQVYQEYIQKQILEAEYEKLGIAFSSEELRSLTITANADPRIKQIPGFQNPETGQFDPNRVITFINSVKEAPADNQEAFAQRQQWIQMEDMLRNSSKISKFTSLINNGIYIPKWLSEQKVKEENQLSDISFVTSSYNTISDSSVQVSDQELKTYLENHKKQFQVKANRSIEYVAFNAVASSEDSANIFSRFDQLKHQFDTLSEDEVEGFITRNSEHPYVDRFVPASAIASNVKEDLMNASNGELYGPYYDEDNNIVLAKKLGSSTIYDTVEVQQLLISNQMESDSVAQFQVDSIENAVKNGADFSQLIASYTQGQAQNNGIIPITPDNTDIPDDFVSFAYNHNVGDVSVLETQYGYHVVKLIHKGNKEKGYKIAYLAESMDPSQETENDIYSQANKFRGLNQNRAKFESSANEQNLNIDKASNLDADSYSINGLSSSREIINWAFNADINDVSKVFVLPNSYVIAVLTDVVKKGTAPLESVRPQIEALVRREKKGEILAEKFNGNSLPEMATAIGDSVQIGSGISFVTPFIPNAGFEPKVVGASFNPEFKTQLSSPVFGENGVYILKVDSIYSTLADSSEIAQTKGKLKNNIQREVGSQLRDVLVDQSDIEDKRFQFSGL